MGKPETKIVQANNVPVEVLREVIRGKIEAANMKQRIAEEYNSRGDVQRHRAMSQDEKIRNARDLMIGRVKTYNDAMKGTDTTQAEAEKKVDSLTQRMLREREGK